jgi:hypothetical protein
MDEKPTTRRSMFAVWRWPKWVLLALSVSAPILYLLSVPLVQYASLVPHEMGIDNGYRSWSAAKWYCAPGNWCANELELIYEIWDWEWRVLSDTFGTIKLKVP